MAALIQKVFTGQTGDQYTLSKQDHLFSAAPCSCLFKETKSTVDHDLSEHSTEGWGDLQIPTNQKMNNLFESVQLKQLAKKFILTLAAYGHHSWKILYSCPLGFSVSTRTNSKIIRRDHSPYQITVFKQTHWGRMKSGTKANTYFSIVSIQSLWKYIDYHSCHASSMKDFITAALRLAKDKKNRLMIKHQTQNNGVSL